MREGANVEIATPDQHHRGLPDAPSFKLGCIEGSTAPKDEVWDGGTS